MVDSIRDDGGAKSVNLTLAAVAGVVTAAAILLWGVPGLDPSMWQLAAVAAGLRPPQAIFPGLWRFVAGWTFSAFGVDGAVRVLTVAGAAVGGVLSALVYLTVRQALALLVRTWRGYPAWRLRIAPFFSFLAAVLVGTSDPFTRIARVLSPDLMLFAGAVVSAYLALRWFVAGSRWRLFPLVAVMGAMSAETPFGFALPAVFVCAYVAVWRGIMDGNLPRPETLPSPSDLPKWRMFFLFLGSLGAVAYANGANFVLLGGETANGWGAHDVYFRYATGYWRAFAGSAGIVGWTLGLVFGVLPLVLALGLFPRGARDDRPMPFNLGVLLFLVAALAVLQTGAFPAARFWTFSKEVSLVHSGFLLACFAACSLVALSLAGAAFAFECQRTYLGDDEQRPGLALRLLVPAIAVAVAVLSFRSVPKPAETEMQRIVDDTVRETVEECGDAKFIFTDGHFDAALELAAKARGKTLHALNMMSSSTPWERYVRSRPFGSDGDDRRNAEMGVPALLRVWAGEKPHGMDEAAIQLGFEFWKRERKPLPTVSGLVAREGMPADAAAAGAERAKAIARRIIEVEKTAADADPSPALASALSAANWRISRLARLREDDDVADELDRSNTALKRMLTALEYERLRTFMQLTPREGLELALRRADFVEARRYAASVLRADEDSTEANFAMGMSELKAGRLADAELYLKRCLKRRPEEPAVLNNLSIICRKQRKYDESVDYARKALKVLPDSPEVKQTLADALKKAP